MIRTLLSIVVASVLAGCATTPEPQRSTFGTTATNGDISRDTMIDVTRTLSSDEFEGRMPGTIGEDKTVALLIEKFREAGLQPANRGSWVQKVPLVEITGSDFAPLTVTGGDTDLGFEYAKDWVGVSYRDVPQNDNSIDWTALRVANLIPKTGLELTTDTFILEACFEAIN